MVGLLVGWMIGWLFGRLFCLFVGVLGFLFVYNMPSLQPLNQEIAWRTKHIFTTFITIRFVFLLSIIHPPPPLKTCTKVYTTWPRLAPTLLNIMCILALVGNDAVKHANYCVSQAANFVFLGGYHDGYRVRSYCAGWRTPTPHKGNEHIT